MRKTKKQKIQEPNYFEKYIRARRLRLQEQKLYLLEIQKALKVIDRFSILNMHSIHYDNEEMLNQIKNTLCNLTEKISNKHINENKDIFMLNKDIDSIILGKHHEIRDLEKLKDL